MDPTANDPPARAVTQLVVVGASAGGVEALSALVASLPTDLPAPVVIAQHLDPRRVSHLDEILSRRSTLPVRTVTGEEPLRTGVVYVVPADRDVEITDHAVGVRPEEGTAPKPSVDLLLASAARIFAEDLIAVILTGTGTDGAAGAQAVKALGGTVIVQNPETAAFPGMPQAVPPSAVDVVADVEAIGPLLGELLSGAYVIPPAGEDGELRSFLEQVRERSGLDFSAYKRPTVVRRLQRRMAAAGTERLGDYRRYVERHPEEMQRLVASFLIKVTEFFRDPELFGYLRDHVLPSLVDEARERGELRMWSAGCATGEEAYTLAMLVADLLGDDLGSLPVRIFATDVATDAVDFARRGVYPESALVDMPPDLVERHFQRLDGAYEVRKAIRGLVVFGEHDLGHRAPFPRIDLVLCRNVLIYFTPELQRRALHLFAFSLRRDGCLVLGKAETVGPLPELFALEQARLKVYRRVGDPVPIPPDRILEAAPLATPAGRSNLRLPSGRRLDPSLPRRTTGEPIGPPQWVRLFDGLPIGVVTVDRGYHVRSINVAARRLLGIYTGAIDEDLVHRVAAPLAQPLRVALDAALRGETSTATAHVPEDATVVGDRDLAITCAPLEPAEDSREIDQAVVVVVDTTGESRRRRDLEAEQSRLRADLERQTAKAAQAVTNVHDLLQANQELAIASSTLRVEREALLVANEEAQAAVEEIETLNEELQATNEELETLNEEMQATVEELTTTNDELQARGVELQAFAMDRERDRRRLEEILRQAPSGMLVLDGPRHVVGLANAAGLAYIGRSEQDAIGRPIAEVQPELVEQGFVALLDRVYATGRPFVGNEMPIRHDRDRDGALEDYAYDVVYQPLRNSAGEVEGILSQSIDVSERVQARRRLEGVLEQLGEERGRLAAILAAMEDAVLVVDPEGRPLLTNAAYERSFGANADFKSEDGDGRPLPADAWPQRLAARGESFTAPFTLPGPDGARRWFEAIGRPFPSDAGEEGGVVVIRDVTERSLRRLQEEFLAVVGHELRTPLTALSGSIQMLGRRLPADADERLRRHATRALDQTRRLEAQIADLMDVARLQTGKLRLDRRPLDLGDVARQAVETAQQLATGQEIRFDGPDAPVTVDGDPRRLEQVLLNLLTNAIAYAPDTERVDVRLRREGDAAVLQIQDYGAGISADALPKLFARFYQAAEGRLARSGLGLGLFIARDIVDLHGGTISAESTVGEGATFTIRLPLLAGDDPDRDAASPPADVPAAPGAA